MKKKCEICGEMKPQEDFSKSYKHRCKECVAQQTRENRQLEKKHIGSTHKSQELGVDVVGKRSERLMVATAAMQGVLSNNTLLLQVSNVNPDANGDRNIPKNIVRFSLSLADALLAEIDKKGGSDD